MKSILINIAIINWVIGMLLILLSNASFIIKPNDVERKGIQKYRMGYSIKEIKAYIHNCDDPDINRKLKRKILYRRLYPLLMLSSVVLIIIANLNS